MNASGQTSNRRNVFLIVAGVILLGALILFWVGHPTAENNGPRVESNPSGSAAPMCVGLKCNDDSDCGSKCRCEIPSGQAVGECIAK